VAEGADTEHQFPCPPPPSGECQPPPPGGGGFYTLLDLHNVPRPGGGRGPVGGTLLIRDALRYCHLSNWAPAFAGVGQFQRVVQFFQGCRVPQALNRSRRDPRESLLLDLLKLIPRLDDRLALRIEQVDPLATPFRQRAHLLHMLRVGVVEVEELLDVA